MRLIDADAIKYTARFTDYADGRMTSDAIVTKDEIDELPTVDPVKHGRWEKLYCMNYKCSCCGAWWTVDRDSTIKDFKHCPNCGARLDL